MLICFKKKDGSHYPKWEEKKIGELCSIQTGKLNANAAVQNGKYYFFTCAREVYRVDTYSFDGDSIIINGNGELGYTRHFSGKFDAYQRVYVLNNFNPSCDYLFLESAVQVFLPKKIRREAIGGAIPYIVQDTLINFVVPYPSIEEQQRIADYLSKIDEKIEAQEKIIADYEEQKKGLMQKIFSQEIRFKRDDGTDYSEWEEKKLGDVCEFIRNGYTYNVDGIRTYKYKITRIESISSGIIDLQRLGSTNEVNFCYCLRDGDILFSHINSLAHIGKVALYTDNLGEIYHGMNLLCLRPIKKSVFPYFLFMLLKTDNVKRWVKINAKPAVNQCSLPASALEILDIKLPCLEEQQKIADCLSAMDRKIEAEKKILDDWKEFKRAMLQELFKEEEK